MTCAHAHMLLAAYRRDDWEPQDAAALGAHLRECAECRRVEAEYRSAGEHIRQLPSLTPPPAFREAVFAAIRAEEQRARQPERQPVSQPAASEREAALARAASAATDPTLPVIPLERARAAQHAKRAKRPTRLQSLPTPARAGLAIAAAVLLTFLATQALPALRPALLGQNANSLPAAAPNQGGVTRYTLASGFAASASAPANAPNDASDASAHQLALASASWLVYRTANASMLVVESRRTRQSAPLLASATRQPIRLLAVTPHWVIWSEGAGLSSAPWALRASRLPASDADVARATAAPLALIQTGAGQGVAPVATLGGVWADGDTALVAGATADGSPTLVRFDLASGQPMATSLTSGAQGRLFADPFAEGGRYYWAEVWSEGGSLRSAIWRLDPDGQRHQVVAGDTAFHPVAAGGALLWAQSAGAAPGIGSSPDAEAGALRSVTGSLQAAPLNGGQLGGAPALIGERVDASSVEAAGVIALWRSAGATHTYDVRARAPSAIERQAQSATFASAGDSTLVWGEQGADPRTLFVYDVR